MLQMTGWFRAGKPAVVSVRRSLGWASALVFSGLLVACGGGSGDPCGINTTCSTTSTGSSTGTTPAVVPVAADLSLVLSSATLLNGGLDTVEARATAVDANRNLLAGVPVTISVDGNATAAVASSVTDANGVVSARVGIGADRSSRVVTVTATSGNLSRTATLQVTGTKIAATPLPATVTPGASGSVRFRVTDVNSSPLVAQAITVNGVGGVDVSAMTDSNGEYLYAFTAPATAGTVNVSASSAGAKTTVGLLVQAAASVPAAVTTPPVASASVSLSSSVVPVNSGATNNLVDVRLLVLRNGNLPAERIRVRFDLDGNTNAIAGSFTTGESLIYTDSSGVARTSYVPGNRTSPLEGVTVRACWDYADFVAGTCPNAARAKLTVVAEPLSVSVGTDNKITFGPTGIDYQKSYLVQVNDASGAPKSEVQISATVDLLSYSRGTWQLVGVDWVQQVQTSGCENEDLNRNSALDRYSNGAVEDANANGQLDPRKADVLVSVIGTGKTNSLGQLVLNLNYPQSVASWVAFRVTVAAGGTAASEGRASFSGVLPVLSEHVISQDRIKPPPTPAFVVSPYGTTATTKVTTTNTDGVTGVLCQ
jgi:Bacterial Ig-like domain (group 1)